MDIIGLFMTRDVFVAATSTESVTFVEEWGSSQREVVPERPKSWRELISSF